MTTKITEDHEIIEASYEDKRTFTEKAFFNQSESDLELKPVVLYDASEAEPEDYPNEVITLLTNYKKGIVRGRKDPLKGRDVLAIKTDKGINYIPIDEAKSYAARIYSLAHQIEKRRSKK